jgi:hypothetical protein
MARISGQWVASDNNSTRDVAVISDGGNRVR